MLLSRSTRIGDNYYDESLLLASNWMKSTALSPSAANWRAFLDNFLSRPASKQIEGLRAGVPACHLRGLAETLNIPQTTVFHLVGLSPPAARRRIALNSLLSTSVSERLLGIGVVEKQAVTVFGCTELAQAWLQTRNVGFGGESPLSQLDISRFAHCSCPGTSSKPDAAR